MKRVLVLSAAAVVVVVSNVWALRLADQNRASAAGGTVEMTERELALEPVIGDSTALLLKLRWRVPSADRDYEDSPDWLDVAKLTELGFDCRVPLTRPDAREFHNVQAPKPVFVVLECHDERTTADATTRLCAIDAGRNASQLRDRYPNRARHIIARGVVRMTFEDRNRRDGTLLAQPRLRGWIDRILPDLIFVPRPQSDTLQSLRRRGDRSRTAETSPRFAATVSWGTRYEPWVQSVRLLPASRANDTTAARTGRSISGTAQQ